MKQEQPAQGPAAQFEDETRRKIAGYRADATWRQATAAWLERALEQRYPYNFKALGRPVIQLPADLVAVHELVWEVKPDLIIETGIAHGGSLVWSAAQLALIEYCEAAEKGETLDPARPRRKVLGIDIDIRAHNRAALDAHPLRGRIGMIEGSSVAPEVVAEVKRRAAGHERIMVFLDSMHTHDHVLAELEAYAPLVGRGSYCIVFDTIVEDLPRDFFKDRPWNPGDNPKTALHAYLKLLEKEGRKAADGAPLALEIDKAYEDKLVLTVAPDGFLKRV